MTQVPLWKGPQWSGVIYWQSGVAFHLAKHKWAVSRGLHTFAKSLMGTSCDDFVQQPSSFLRAGQIYRVLFFNCSSQFSVPKWKTSCSQPGLLFQEIFNVKKLFIGWACCFILVLKMGRKSKKKHPVFYDYVSVCMSVTNNYHFLNRSYCDNQNDIAMIRVILGWSEWYSDDQIDIHMFRVIFICS